jgi:hypothetical protein
MEYGSTKGAIEAHPEIEHELRLRDGERAARRAAAFKTTPAGMMRAVVRGGGKVEVSAEGVATVTPGRRLAFTEADRAPSPHAPTATSTWMSTPTPRAREGGSRRVGAERSPPSGDDSDPLGRPERRLLVDDREVAAIADDVLRLTRPHVTDEVVGRRLWAQLMLAPDVETCRSIGAGRRVMAARLDPEVLRRGLRGGRLPHPAVFIEVSAEMLDAISEAGPLTRKEKRWRSFPRATRKAGS